MKIHSDSPIEHLEEDAYKRIAISNAIIETIGNSPIDKSIVIGLYGKWGSGKTSIINLTLSEIASKSGGDTQQSNSLPFMVIRLNPWMFPNAKELTASLFSQIANAFNEHQNNSTNQQVARLIRKYALVVCSSAVTAILSIKTGLFPALVLKLSDIVNWKALRNLATPKSIEQIRSEIDLKLKESYRKVVIAIDDVDRLNTNEICEVIQFIRATCDFSNSVWIFACDKHQVTNALDSRYGSGRGEPFLEKIIQIPVEIPDLNNDQIRKVVFERMNDIVAHAGEEENDAPSFLAFYANGISHLITSPRNIVQYTNLVSKKISECNGEICIHDIAAIEAIHCAQPMVYEKIMRNFKLFIENHDDTSKLKALLQEFENFPNYSAMLYLIKMIFPFSERAIRSFNFGYNPLPKWRTDRRIAHPSLFNFYLSLNYQEGDISRVEFLHFIDTVSNIETATDMLRKLPHEKYRGMIQQLIDFKQNYQSEWVVSLAISVLNSIDILEPRPSSIDSMGDQIIISVLILQLLETEAKRGSLTGTLDAILDSELLPSAKSLVIDVIGHEDRNGHNLCEEEKWKQYRDALYAIDFSVIRELVPRDPFFSDYVFSGIRQGLISPENCLDPLIFFQILKTGQSYSTTTDMNSGRTVRKLTVPVKTFIEAAGKETISSVLTSARSIISSHNDRTLLDYALKQVEEYTE